MVTSLISVLLLAMLFTLIAWGEYHIKAKAICRHREHTGHGMWCSKCNLPSWDPNN